MKIYSRLQPCFTYGLGFNDFFLPLPQFNNDFSFSGFFKDVKDMGFFSTFFSFLLFLDSLHLPWFLGNSIFYVGKALKKMETPGFYWSNNPNSFLMCLRPYFLGSFCLSLLNPTRACFSHVRFSFVFAKYHPLYDDDVPQSEVVGESYPRASVSAWRLTTDLNQIRESKLEFALKLRCNYAKAK